MPTIADAAAAAYAEKQEQQRLERERQGQDLSDAAVARLAEWSEGALTGIAPCHVDVEERLVVFADEEMTCVAVVGEDVMWVEQDSGDEWVRRSGPLADLAALGAAMAEAA